jgi:hypothetical protein
MANYTWFEIKFKTFKHEMDHITQNFLSYAILIFYLVSKLNFKL